MKYTIDTAKKIITIDIIDNIKLKELKFEIIKLEEIFEEYTVITSISIPRTHANPFFNPYKNPIPIENPYINPVKNPYIISCTNNTLK